MLVRTGPGYERRQRADVHDPAAPELDHVGEHELHQAVAREEPDLEVQPVPLEREAEERAGPRRGRCAPAALRSAASARRRRAVSCGRAAGHRQRGVVDQQVDGTECGARFVDQAVDVVLVGEVGADRDRAPAVGLDGVNGLVDRAREAFVEDLLGARRHRDRRTLAANSRATASPMPRLAPVTIATRPVEAPFRHSAEPTSGGVIRPVGVGSTETARSPGEHTIMDMNDLILVSVDDHVVEPPDLFEGHLPAKYADQRAAASIRKDDGTDVWVFEGNEIPNIGLNAVAGRPPEEYGIDPTSLRRDAPRLLRHPRARPRHERQRRARLAVLPVVPEFCGQLFARTDGQGRSACAMLQAYNDWHIDEWCGTLPRPLHPARAPADLGPAADGRRGAPRRRRRAATRSRSPRTRSKLGCPSFHARPLGPVLAGVRGRGHGRLPAHRLVVAAGDHRDRTRRST